MLLQNTINGNEIFISIAVCQIISNVPCALLLSGFTHNVTNLLIGTNIGGLGTLIASMASLISYKQIAKAFPEIAGTYPAASGHFIDFPNSIPFSPVL